MHIQRKRRWQKDFDRLYEYLKEHPTERLFQAIANCFGFPYLGSANDYNGKDFEDLFHRE